MNAVTSLEEYREANGIKHLLGQPWPSSKREFLAARRESCDQQPRTVICAHCEKQSRPLSGPAGHHKTVCEGAPA